MERKHLLLLCIVTAAFFASTLTATAQTTTSAPSTTSFTTTETAPPPAAKPDDDWHLSLSFPVWVAGVGGKVTVRGHEFSPDQDTGDVVDIWDTYLNMAAVGHFEAEKSRFGGIVDAMYLDLRSKRNGSDTDNEGILKGFVGELDGFYEVIAPDPDQKGWGTFRVDALAGVRLSSVKFGVHVEDFEGSTDITIYDPIVGARLTYGITDWLSFRLRGDVGGFGIDAWPTSTFSWNIDTGLDVHLAKWCDVGVGYRWLKYDFTTDSGDSRFDAILSGPVINILFNF